MKNILSETVYPNTQQHWKQGEENKVHEKCSGRPPKVWVKRVDC